MNIICGLLAVVYLWYFANAQQFGPVPPRPQQFAGATLVQGQRSNLRQRPSNPRTIPELIQPIEPIQANRLRRPPQPLRKTKTQFNHQQVLDQQRTNLVDDVSNSFNSKAVGPTPVPQFQQQTTKLTPRPVEEETNEEEDVVTTVITTPSTTAFTTPLRQTYPQVPVIAPGQPAGIQRTSYLQPTAFRVPATKPVLPVQSIQPIQTLQPTQYSEPSLQGRQLIRQQTRPVQQPVAPQIPSNSEPVTNEEQYFRQVQARPLKKQEPARQQTIEPFRQQTVRQPEVVRQQYIHPVTREPHTKTPTKERKPVVQTIRKYHEEHEDGSITWGYENDDGSFKEETIGVDCVTRGKYGYYDPDGVKREYTYQTGIPCDKAQESEEAASNQGFIDYTNNKYVLPNGDEIDLEAMVKNRARKPVSQYRY